MYPFGVGGEQHALAAGKLGWASAVNACSYKEGTPSVQKQTPCGETRCLTCYIGAPAANLQRAGLAAKPDL